MLKTVKKIFKICAFCKEKCPKNECHMDKSNRFFCRYTCLEKKNAENHEHKYIKMEYCKNVKWIVRESPTHFGWYEVVSCNSVVRYETEWSAKHARDKWNKEILNAWNKQFAKVLGVEKKK